MKILLLDSNHPSLQEGLEALGCTCDADFNSSKSEVEKVIHRYEGVVIRSRIEIDREFLDKAKKLKFIARVGAGLDSIDVQEAEKRNIAVLSAPEGNRTAVGEHAVGMLLMLFNNLKRADAEIRKGQWRREANRGVELSGKTVGIIGYGNMGKAFARTLKGFEVEVICYDILDGVGDAYCRQVPLEELQERADVVSLHTPFNALSYKMVNAAFIKAFHKPFYLINTARGNAVVTKDLVSALIDKKVLGACLDVLEYEKASFENLFDDEALPEAFNFLIKAENVLLSPHIAGWTAESKVKLASTIVNKVADRFFSDFIEEELPGDRVTGIGGVFFKTKDPKAIKAWYRKHLGFNVDDWGCTFHWKELSGNDAITQWGPFEANTDYFSPSNKEFMLNYRVNNLEKLLEQLKAEGIDPVKAMETYPYGKFCWIMDPDGNKIELWEPVEKGFTTED